MQNKTHKSKARKQIHNDIELADVTSCDTTDDSKDEQLKQIQQSYQIVSQKIDESTNNNSELVSRDLQTVEDQLSKKDKIKPIIGMIFAMGSIVSVAITMQVFKRLQQANPEFTTIELMIVRGYSQAFFQFIQYKIMKVKQQTLDKQQKSLIAQRTIINIITMYAYWYALQYLQMAVLSSIVFLIPFITLIIGYFTLRETLKFTEIINMILSFGGMLLIVCFQEKQNIQNEDQSSMNVDQLTYYISILIAFAQSFGMGYVYILIRKLKAVHFTVINGIYGIVLSIVSTIVWYLCRKLPNPEIEYNFDSYQIILLVITGIFGNLTNQLQIIALQYDKASRIAALNFFQVLFSFVGDIVFFGQTFSYMQFAGAILIGCCSSVIMLMKYLNYSE
ncbi:membrane protein [Stylonychia lemnae]|uniref:Membrane protein n=1 Tax=Stylonychia lemnae TaxID=5949 RepID=A0A078AQK1_STYLE|nr:membrane protein [Stylonychia lemnae]|eukprot:CDW84454.1 membrane protein [Stylonychia lemnae]